MIPPADKCAIAPGVVIRPATETDLPFFWNEMREEDRAEFDDNFTYEMFLDYLTPQSFVFEHNGTPVGFLGLQLKLGVVWVYFIGTPQLFEIKKTFHCAAKKIVRALKWEQVSGRRVLTYTHSKYKKAIRWLKLLGFEQVTSKGDFYIMELK